LPIYEYRCDACGHTLEAFQKFSDKPLETCEVCGGHLSKVLHPAAIHFKGSGFYTTDYGRGSKKVRAANDASAKAADESKATAAKSDGGGAKKSDAAGGGDAAARRSTTDKTG